MSDNLHQIEITALSCSINCLMIDRKFVNKTIFNQLPVISPFCVPDDKLFFLGELNVIGKVINSKSGVFLENSRYSDTRFFESSLWLIFTLGDQIYKYPYDSDIHEYFELGVNVMYYRSEYYNSNIRRSNFDKKCKDMIDDEFKKAKQIYIGKPF